MPSAYSAYVVEKVGVDWVVKVVGGAVVSTHPTQEAARNAMQALLKG